MAVTKQVYTASATPSWTAAQAASIFRSAFIDAGLMTEWFDSFTSSGVENRVLEVTYNGAKAYGKTYYWFVFNGSGIIAYHVATGWNAQTDQPSGTQYLDYFSTSTSAVNNHRQLMSVSLSSDIRLTRYTSSVDTGHSWFVVSQGSTSRAFHIAKASSSLHSWVDLDKGFLNLFYEAQVEANNNRGQAAFMRFPSLRRELGKGTALAGNTSNTAYAPSTSYSTSEYVYVAAGAVSGTAISNYGSNLTNVNQNGIILLPIGFNAVNPAYSTNSSPVFHSLLYSQWFSNTLTSDFGISALYTTNTVAAYDKLIVSAGVEEWEVLAFGNNATINTGASMTFLARVV